MKMYFRLKPEVYLELGDEKSVVYNLIDTNFIHLDKENTEKLLMAENNFEIQKSELFDNLEKMGWGDYHDRKVFHDKLRKYNIFNLNKFWKEAPNVTLATLQITNACENNCNLCNEIFCPLCVKSEDKTNCLTLEQCKNIINKISFYGVKSIILTGGDLRQVPFINELIEFITFKNINIEICIVGGESINIKENLIRVNILVSNRHELDKTMKNYRMFKNVRIFASNKSLLSGVKSLNPNWIIQKVDTDQNSFSTNNLIPVNLDRYFDRRMSDICLNNKITIDANGNVIPCMGNYKKKLYNVFENKMHDIIKGIEKDYWNINILNKEEYPKCSSCEFKYACNKCRFSNQEENCIV